MTKPVNVITIESIGARNFKSHKRVSVNLEGGQSVVLTGPNGVGKTTIGEIVTFTLGGVDLMGTSMNKESSPEPTTYDFDRVETMVELLVNGSTINLGAKMEKGKAVVYLIDGIEKKATEYKEFIKSLFDLDDFLAVFSPAFFFSQTWQEQRKQVTRYITPAAESEILEKMPEHQAAALKPFLSKGTAKQIEDTHKKRMKESHEDLIRLRERVSVLSEQKESTEVYDVEALKKELVTVEAAMTANVEVINENLDLDMRRNNLESRKKFLYDKTKDIATRFNELKGHPIDDTCPTCAQSLPEESKALANDAKTSQLKTLKAQHAESKKEYESVKEALLYLPEKKPLTDNYELADRKSMIKRQLELAEQAKTIDQTIQAARDELEKASDSYKTSVTIVDAIGEYNKAEAQLNSVKITNIFPGLTVNHEQVNKGDGKVKPYFEVCYNGKLYRKLSYGEKMKAGILLSAGMINLMGVKIPVFVDNAESLTSAINIDTQVLACYATGKNDTDDLEIKTFDNGGHQG